MMIEFETKNHGTINAPLSAVVYTSQDKEKFFVVLAGQADWEIDQTTYDQIRDAIRGYAIATDES